jgi:hypothetical protein
MKLGHSLISVLIFVFAGCESNVSDTHDVNEKSYPSTSNLPVTTVHDILSNQIQGDFNITVYVNGMNICPEGWRCDMADGITVTDEYHAELSSGIESLHLVATYPGQFEIGKRYTMSVTVTPTMPAHTLARPWVDLIGYKLFRPRHKRNSIQSKSGKDILYEPWQWAENQYNRQRTARIELEIIRFF